MKRSIHIEAPVEKVFDFVKDPRNVPEGVTVPYEVTDVKLTEGRGHLLQLDSKTPGLGFEGFGVYTEFILNQRITDRSSWSIFGDFIPRSSPKAPG